MGTMNTTDDEGCHKSHVIRRTHTNNIDWALASDQVDIVFYLLVWLKSMIYLTAI